MNIEKEIIAEAQRLFDAAGIASDQKDSIIILGMATSPECDLDDFFRDENGSVRLSGFEAHVQPRLDSLVSFLREKGLSAEILGRCGYPLRGEPNLKQLAVAAGLCHWGKNAMVLHHRFGPRFRLMVVKIAGATLSPTGPGSDSHTENPLCKDCTACLDACSPGVLEPYYLQDRSSCLASFSKLRQMGKVVPCDRCWVVCPMGQ